MVVTIYTHCSGREGGRSAEGPEANKKARPSGGASLTNGRLAG